MTLEMLREDLNILVNGRGGFQCKGDVINVDWDYDLHLVIAVDVDRAIRSMRLKPILVRTEYSFLFH